MIKLSSLLIGVSDLNKARPFYEQVFGVTFDEFRPPFASFILGGVEFNVEENTPTRSANWAEYHIGTRKQFSFQVDDLEVFLIQAKQAGATIVQQPELKPWGWKEAIIADPDQNEFLIEQEVIE